ncbi:MAG: hypothetical protein IPQ04_06830 [Saprospiraceae bacterium]|jgi:hypothetical protein|nr:hypothetical protein [Saprospiraceae bacterium]
MGTAELKIDIINKITNLKEVRIIEEIQKMLDFEMDKGDFILNAAQKSRILDAKQDKVLIEEEANSDTEKWLQER